MKLVSAMSCANGCINASFTAEAVTSAGRDTADLKLRCTICKATLQFDKAIPVNVIPVLTKVNLDD